MNEEMKLIKICTSENYYSGHGWNFEKTKKYIFEIGTHLVEIGVFRHYLEGKIKKYVIEMPSSYGCRFGCKYCASSKLKPVDNLTTEQMNELLDFVYENEQFYGKRPLLITFTGIGDLYYTADSVLKSMEYASNKYDDIQFTVSTCNMTEEVLKKLEKISKCCTLRKVQITYIHFTQEVTQNIIPFFEKREYRFEKVVQLMEKSDLKCFRINYLMLKGVNDTIDDFEKFILFILPVKDKIIIRISALNQTQTAVENNLKAVSLEKLHELESLLKEKGISAYVYFAYENDFMNCGQLLTEKRYD